MKIDEWFNKNRKLIGIGIIIFGLQMVISGIVLINTTVFPETIFAPAPELNITVPSCSSCGFQLNSYTIMSLFIQILSVIFGIILIILGNRIRK